MELAGYRYYFSNSDRVADFTTAKQSCLAWQGYLIYGVTISEYAQLSEHFDQTKDPSYWTSDGECTELVMGALVQPAPCDTKKQYICKKSADGAGGSSGIIVSILIVILVAVVILGLVYKS